MARTIQQYCAAHPIHKGKRTAKTASAEKIVSVGWAWNPDDATRKALARGNRKIRKAKAAEIAELMEGKPMATSKKTGTKKVSKKVAKKVTKKTTAKKTTKKTTGKLVTLKSICTQLNIDTRLARRKLRNADIKGHDSQSRWEFTDAQAKQVTDLLKA